LKFVYWRSGICQNISTVNASRNQTSKAVAYPGFDLGGRRLCQWGGDKRLLKVLKVEVKLFLACFFAILLLKVCLKLIASENISVLGIKKS